MGCRDEFVGKNRLLTVAASLVMWAQLEKRATKRSRDRQEAVGPHQLRNQLLFETLSKSNIVQMIDW